MSFYLKFRPQKIQELDLVSVRDTLTDIIKSKNIPHAFLFAGPKGTGKTSAARILAKCVNCENPDKNGEPCDECEQCVSIRNGSNIDCIEIDAASHRGIDDVRSLREAVKLAPASARKKVYIIDEAHMLTTEASNALLKTLEEPPEHVIFILATTNPEKLIPTIRSRTTLVAFKKASTKEIVSSLEKKIKSEKIKIDKDALQEIAQLADGSFRDADKVLEQLSVSGNTITRDSIQKIGIGGGTDFRSLLDKIIEKDVQEALTLLDEFAQMGDMGNVIDGLMKMVRSMLLSKVGLGKDEVQNITKSELIRLTKLLIEAKRDTSYAFIAQIPLEVAIIEWCGEETGGGEGKVKVESKESQKSAVHETEKETSADTDEIKAKIVIAADSLPETEYGDSHLDEVTSDVWKAILVKIREINASTEALLRASRPLDYDGKNLKLGVYYSFHKEHLESMSHRAILEGACSDILGTKVHVDCKLTKPLDEPIKTVAETVNGSSTAQPAKVDIGGSINLADEVLANANGSLTTKTVIVETGNENHDNGNHSNGNHAGATVITQQNDALTEGGDLDIMRAAEEIFSD